MRAISSAASISIHAAVAAAFLLGPTKSARPSPIVASSPLPLVFPEPTNGRAGSGSGVHATVPDIPPLELSSLPLPGDALQREAIMRSFLPTDWAPRAGPGEGMPLDGSGPAMVGTTGPEVLSGPLPVYPELFRQAGIEGRVILEARVDSTGRVRRASISVVSATHPGFVEPARQALIATLFRPARVNGRAVSTLVRVPFAFSIRGGPERAW